MPLIYSSYNTAKEEAAVLQKKDAARTKAFLWVCAAFILILCVLVWFVYNAYRAKRDMLATIAEINVRLRDQNERLAREDALKLRHINSLMMAYAEYISRLKGFRKNIYRLLKTGQADKAMDMVRGDREESRDVAAFHEMFDEAFLSMFPDFVDRVNRYMDSPLVQKVPERLTPELRVAAMVALGMTSTEEIAGMLHYSAQTVYNLRSSLRSSLRVKWEEFVESLRSDRN